MSASESQEGVRGDHLYDGGGGIVGLFSVGRFCLPNGEVGMLWGVVWGGGLVRM